MRKAQNYKLEQVKITVAVSTMGAALSSLRLPPPQSGIRYLILVQNPGRDPFSMLSEELLKRSDFWLESLSGSGLSRSRNAALERVRDPLLVFSDDDLVLDPEGLLELGEEFVKDPMLDLAAGWRRELGPNGGSRRLTLFNCGRICAPELMVRTDAIRSHEVSFDFEFGLGARYGLGEEYVFITDALKAGCKGMSFPVVTGSHPHSSTGDDWQDTALMRARQAMLKRVFGRWDRFIRPVYAWRHRRRFRGIRAVLHFALGLSVP